MARKNYTAVQIIGMLLEVRVSQGEKVGAICPGLERIPTGLNRPGIERTWSNRGNAIDFGKVGI